MGSFGRESGVWRLPRATERSTIAARRLQGGSARPWRWGAWCGALLFLCAAMLIVALTWVEIARRLIELGQPSSTPSRVASARGAPPE